MPLLADYFSIKRRYSRSVNLERDIETPDSVQGYIPTTRAIDVIGRFFRASSNPYSVRAWTLTGAYGTGKSSFAHFLSALCSPKSDQSRINAFKILNQVDKENSFQHLVKRNLSEMGLIRAVVTAQREPLANAIIRALNRGASIFWRRVRGPRPKVLGILNDLTSRALSGQQIDSQRLIDVFKSLAEVSKTGILLIIDELGKILEFCAQNQSLEDLYLLQQLAELPSSEEDPKIFVFGLLHQSFADYAHGLTAAQMNEWAKIQGRFEDIPFIESSERVIRLIGQAIDCSKAEHIAPDINKWAIRWNDALNKYDFSKNISLKDISSVYPLHPLSAIILPILCMKFSQNDRTLFTFLASTEPNSFTSFLDLTSVEGKNLPTFKLHRIYDYFVEAASMSISLRPQLQRWIEIQSRITDAKYLDQDAVLVMKTIGILNLVSTTGSTRATRESVALTLCNSPNEQNNMTKWDKIIDQLLAKGFLTWRKQLDELRIWEGSDFDIEKEISEQSQMLNISLAELLGEKFPFRPIIAQRHSYQTGTLRYFERQYFDDPQKINSADCKSSDSDGLICYWLGKERDLKKFPSLTEDGRPVIIICGTELNHLRLACYEYTALKNMESASQLQTDGVARREVRQRIMFASRLLDEALSNSFNVASGNVTCHVRGRKEKFKNWTSFNIRLSGVCDEVYDKGLRLWNELINRRELTSQGSTARRKLIEAMLQNEAEERLGLVGHGPEFSMYESLLRKTEIHKKESNKWIFSTPNRKSGCYQVWKAIENFCISASDSPKGLESLYEHLECPPYGVKKGVIPVLLLSILLYHNDYISVYLDGTFIPVLGPEHFELLVKRPKRFAVKYFEISGLKLKIFKELEKIISPKISKTRQNTRNSTVLSIVKPLVRFVTKLPPYTLNTNRISPEAKAIRKALFEAREPDNLLFEALPRACGMLFNATNADESSIGKIFCKKLFKALKELQTTYDDRLLSCKDLLYRAFSVRSDKAKLREDLRVRATYLVGKVIEPRLKSFVIGATNEGSDENSWLESLLMIVANKPPTAWTDDDVRGFEIELSDMARRFGNLEALQKKLSSTQNEGFDACKLTVTYPDGNEIHKMVWVDREDKEKIHEIAQQFLEDESIKNNKRLKQAVIAALAEKVLSERKEKSESEGPNLKREMKIA